MLITDRYATAIRSSNLAVDERTTYSDSDVLGAAGLAAKNLPIGGGMARLVYGDNHATEAIVQHLTEMTFEKSFKLKLKITKEDARLVSQACLAWSRDGSCKHCGGHGKVLIKGTKTLGDRDCHVCQGSGRIPLERQFSVDGVKELARWLVNQIEMNLSLFAPAVRDRVQEREIQGGTR